MAKPLALPPPPLIHMTLRSQNVKTKPRGGDAGKTIAELLAAKLASMDLARSKNNTRKTVTALASWHLVLWV